MLFRQVFAVLSTVAVTALANPIVGELHDASRLEKPILSPPLPDLSADLNATFKTPVGVYQSSQPPNDLEYDYIPEACLKHWEDYDTHQLWHLDASYVSCNQTWNGCFHQDAGYKAVDIWETLAKVPTPMRAYIRHIIALPTAHPNHSPDGNAVWHDGDDIIVKGRPTMHAFFHAVAKLVIERGFPGAGGPYHEKREWLDAYNKDTAVPTNTARVNQLENAATHILIALYDLRIPGGIAKVLPGWEQIKNERNQIIKDAQVDFFGHDLAPSYKYFIETQCVERRARDSQTKPVPIRRK